MKVILLLSILIAFTLELKSRSEEFYECINPYKTVESASDCNSIIIPESEGHKCCMMQITFNGNISKNCFTIETNYTTSKEKLEEYISKKGIGAFFIKQGGKVEIICNDDVVVEENYVKISDEFFNCYDGNKNGAKDENDCINYEIPENETCKCCYVEVSKLNKSGILENDKRCYIISDLYFSKKKNMRDFLLEQSNVKNLNDINDTNVTIRCKNYNTFYYISNQNYSNEIYPITEYSSTYITSQISLNSQEIQTDITTNKDLYSSDNEITNNIEKKKKSSKTWLIILLIVIIVIVIVGTLILLIYKFKRKNNTNTVVVNTENNTQISKVGDITNNKI